jgi:hypothetical protein
MRLLYTIWRSGRGRAILITIAGYFAWQLWLTLAAPGKVAPGVWTQTPRVDVLVTLPFPPERFHVLIFQQYGRVSGTQDNSVEVRGVKQTDLRSLARPYWVKKVEPLSGGE